LKLDARTLEKAGRCLLHRRGKLPLEVQIELTNRCNLDCPMCPREKIGAPETHMSHEIFEKVLAGIGGVGEVILTGWGEPLVHPQFFELVARLKEAQAGRRVRFTTNGTLLNQERIDRIVATGIDSVTISMDSMEEEDELGHGSASKVSENVRRLIQAKGSAAPPAVVIQLTMTPNGKKDLLDVIEFAADAKASYVNLIRLMTQFDPELKRPNEDEELEMIRNARRLGKKLGIPVVSINEPTLGNRLLTRDDSLCIKTVYHAYVTVEGKVAPCCNLRDQEMGDLANQTLSQIWSGNGFSEFQQDQVSICAGCDTLKVRQSSPEKRL
jgi:MoaA/NifB/PqqE/SkfB family radical SAM enzyme